MNRAHLKHALATPLLARLALAGCKKQDEAVATPPVTTEPTPPAASTAPAPAPAGATVTVVSVDLGNAVGTDNRVTTPLTTFPKTGVIMAAVSTSTSDPAATVPGKLGARWTFQDGQVVHEETQDVNFTGPGLTTFQISKPDGWPAGSYKVEILLDGSVVQSRDFTVQ